MSLLLTGLVAAGSALFASLAMRRIQKRRDAKDAAPDRAESSDVERSPARIGRSKPERKPPPVAAPAPLPPDFPCQLGDVLMTRSGDEAWLAGAWILEEDVPVAAIFFGPDAGADRVVYVRKSPRAAVLWLSAVSNPELPTSGEPPTSLELDGSRFERVRRVPFKITRVGSGAPDADGNGVVSEYTGVASARLLVVSGQGALRVFAGDELAVGSYEFITAKGE